MKFFSPDDFKDENISDFSRSAIGSDGRITAAQLANAKLERDGKVVYGENNIWNWTERKTKSDSHKALLINIESIEKCTHPKEKVRPIFAISAVDEIEYYKCQCGSRVQPTEFEACK